MNIAKTRFAPSPTGLIHMGNARTALFSALLAHHLEGDFLLRIEDTDRERSKEEYTHALMRDLCWIDSKWQEGPDIGGELGPYWQSERQAIYDRYYKQLEAISLAYPCFCSEAQLALTRKVQRAAGQAPRYPGTCRGLSATEIQTKIEQGLQPVLRFHVSNDAIIEFEDLVKGKQVFKGHDIGDFIIRRANGFPSFMFTNAIDDSMMKVTHVLRGEDHLTNSPRQLLILRALEMTPPQYGHISLILGDDGSPLSKRHGSKSLQALREDGWLPEALMNYMARLGHYYPENDFMSFEELAQKFAIPSLSKSPARFDPAQMRYWQKEAVLKLDNDRFWHWLSDYQIADAPRYDSQLSPEIKNIFAQAIKPNILFPVDAWQWFNVFFNNKLNISSDDKQTLKAAGSEFFGLAIAAAQTVGNDIKEIAKHVKALTGKKGKELFMPLRIALTGQAHGPDFGAINQLLDKEQMITRLQSAQEITNA
jgi:glutamyl-tRNA synthetase